MALWDDVYEAALAEVSDLPDAGEVTRVVLRLLAAMLLGAAIGYDRERKASPAGLRTHMLVALGAALFVIVPATVGFDAADMSRVVQGLVAGIGFLGAGTIMKLDAKEEIRGLTTAASIWVTAAIAMTAGLGHLMTAVLATALVMVVLAVLPRLEVDKSDTP